ncbi:Vacuolar protein sorting-associated protein 52 B [Penicillium subrubescens]|uniref:Vacuolar protein sorting-associated protein 52 B n=1 Tax=Penicillium subrubescens TaxID=1316194 RepID=A0A1Q5UMP7_9EURO|nr:Vacuolar protein sorting-associated protein 52 B [Penicillium subrubescens]
MWRDRISGQSTPSSVNRAPSLPRRSSSQLSRGPYNNRPGANTKDSSTSLLLTPSDSSTSLSAAARGPNGTGLRQTSGQRPRPVTVSDPLEVLNGIIGINKSEKAGLQLSSQLEPRPEELIEVIEFDGLSLEEFVAKADVAPTRKTKRSEVNAQTVKQFEQERDKFQDLHTSITGCDDVSKSVELYLNDFQTELGAVSAEIETLQTRSTQLNAMLDNRRNVERLLGPAVEEISISPKTVRTIVEGPMDENWVRALNEIDARTASIEAKASSSSGFKAIEDVRPLLVDVKNKAIERIRDYLVSQIRAMRSPNINSQIIQQQRLVKFKDLYTYLSKAHPDLAGQIAQAYINTMRWYYTSNFTRYLQALEKIKVYPSDRNEVLGGDASAHRTGNILPGGRAGSAAHDPFSLGRRIDILRNTNQQALSSYLAEQDNAYHGIEVPFRNFNVALVDNVAAEYSFLTEFFSPFTFHEISRKVVEIFQAVFALGQSLTKKLIDNTTDSLGVLICVRLNQHSAFELQRRKVPVADSYVNGINMHLWPRFQVIMDLHGESLKRAGSNTGRSAVSALSLAGGDDLKQSSAPHFLTQRFGQLLHGILVLSSDAGDDEPVANSLARLRSEFDTLLAKLSRNGTDAKRRERFLFNNYSLILTIISVIGAGVVGLSVARQLAAREGTSTILLERHDAPGTETSSRNSEVIHAGLYYPASSLKTKLCIRGRNLLYELCSKHAIPHRNTKKWIVAQTPEQWEACLRVHTHAQALGDAPTRLVGAAEAAAREPDVKADAGIVESETTGIVDSHSLMTYLHGDFEDRGGDCAFKTQVTGVEPVVGGGYKITAVSGEDGSETSITADTVINSAGHGACAINNLLLPPERHRIPHYAKGTYFSYSASRPRTSVLVYPVTMPGHGGLGTHLTLDMGGRIRFGPDVEWVDDPNDLQPSSTRLEQAIPEILSYMPGVDPSAIALDYCGIRPKLGRGGAVNVGQGFQDFIIEEEEGFPGFVNLLGIESPGLTSCLAIGEMVDGMLYR